MKVAILLLLSLCSLLVGCQSMESAKDSVKERWTARNSGRTHVYAADSKAVYSAAREATRTMGFRILKGGAAQGTLEAIGGVQSDDNLRTSRQIGLKVRIGYAPEGSELRLFLTEMIEDDFDKGPGRATESPLMDTPLYEVFFRTVEQNLKAQK
jgi:hypothetical protein